VVSGQMGGHRPRKLVGVHRNWLLERAKTDFTLRGLQAELAGRGMTVDYRTVWSFVHDEGLSFKKSVLPAEQLRPAIARRREQWKKYQGRLDPARLVFIDETWAKPVLSLSKGRTWPRCGDGHLGASDYTPRCLTGIGVR